MDVKLFSCDVSKITPDIQSKIAELFQKHTTDEEQQTIFNILLVFTCVRRAYLADTMSKPEKKLIQTTLKILNASKQKPKLKLRNIKGLNIVYVDEQMDSIKDFDDEQLGRVLGFHCVGHEYGNEDLHRLGLYIVVTTKETKEKKFHTYAEVCVVDEKHAQQQYKDIEKFMKHKTDQYQVVADRFGFDVQYEIEDIPGNQERVKRLRNNQYIETHIDQYLNDIFNHFGGVSRLLDMDYKTIVETGLLELLKFEHWTSTGLGLYEELFEFDDLTEDERSKLTYEQRMAMMAAPEKLLKDFEFDLMTQKDLLKLPYKKWLTSPILKHLVRIKYPDLIPLFI